MTKNICKTNGYHKKIQKMRDEGKSYEETRCKYAFLSGDSYIRKIYDSTEDQMIQL